MSCIDCPPTLSGLCSPHAHRTASVMFDLPQPLGPTITLTPGENTSLVRSGKDLKPLIVIELRCTVGEWWRSPQPARGARKAFRPRRTCFLLPTNCLGAEPVQRLLGGRLLGRLLA